VDDANFARDNEVDTEHQLKTLTAINQSIWLRKITKARLPDDIIVQIICGESVTLMLTIIKMTQSPSRLLKQKAKDKDKSPRVNGNTIEMENANIASDESQSADEYVAEAMESNFMNMKELNNTLHEKGMFLMYAYMSIKETIMMNCHSMLFSKKQVITCTTTLYRPLQNIVMSNIP
jgi:hypothetical protein